MSGITLSKAVRSNLLNLQGTAELLSKSQERLATGLRVNSALDNPTNFFTASGLNSRASDLSQLLDSVSNAIQTVAAADKGITAITKLVESAQATARQALQTATTVSQTSVSAEATVTGSVAIGADTAATTAGTIDLSGDLLTAGVTNGQSLTITIGSVTKVIAFNATGTPGVGEDAAVDLDGIDNAPGGGDDALGSDLVSAINTAFGGTPASLDGSDQLVLTAPNTADSITITGTAKAALGGTGLADADPTNAAITALFGANLTVGGNTLTFAAGAGGISNRAELATALAGLTGGITGSLDGTNHVVLTGSAGNSFTVGGTVDALAAFGITEQAYNATMTTANVVNPKRADLVDTYNDLLVQIDGLVKDAGFNGVNLLNGDNLSVLFNEDGSSKLDITGLTDTAAGLGLTPLATTAFDTNASINATLDDLKGTLDTLRTQASQLGSNLSIIETRQDFTKNMINVLETGASNLTLADTNEEAANVLALQTRQQLSSTALSLSSQADQNVLRLFS
jgi:flagellin-like hook-associated protein FlgL